MTNSIKINEHISVGGNNPFVLIAGPCVIESEQLTMEIVESIKEVTDRLDIPFIFKASFDKANRTSIYSERGPGMKKGLEILSKIKDTFNVPVTSDIHEPYQAEPAGKVLDIIQIPAFLCRQTDLLVAAAKTGRVINIKKGQFLAPWDMGNIVVKLKKSGNDDILLTERGSTFGYNNLVVDMRSIPQIQEFGTPVVFDATHSVQMPGGNGSSTDGRREFVPFLSRSAAAVGIDALFIEVHPNPDNAWSDGSNMLKLEILEETLRPIKEIDSIVKCLK
ncbi:3-deoxy-8-phosphooctulonate synthase [Staphylococcus equorum]|uniref:3-deoxy-8-phosphooctulonate synthase n=1 Tax=Staphylococcus equorum TaxID=246432 RepID=UPI002DB76004|nr:3-deoxy-8-phosphooctulonate synthase [Staphylococcus equorum]MEB7723124.1 3-deoxy-8-phosphooctulonate synthase [Staphylococcus equorum]